MWNVTNINNNDTKRDIEGDCSAGYQLKKQSPLRTYFKQQPDTQQHITHTFMSIFEERPIIPKAETKEVPKEKGKVGILAMRNICDFIVYSRVGG